ncbi:hypothetical protein TIFTF001_004150 [Ficus carica]|uniref:Uncharacterized protein n=1 Tax=Ficus carica TaxID=3494 RepID=A0AA88CSR4_FICCA|nr:hypothetical protein TIFTF001_004150 [Ficus carica]
MLVGAREGVGSGTTLIGGVLGGAGRGWEALGEVGRSSAASGVAGWRRGKQRCSGGF